MITRYALFEGRIRDGLETQFRQAVLDELVPTWRAFPGARDVRVTFVEDRDEGAPQFVMILAVDYLDQAQLDQALASPERLISRAATERVLPRFFDGRIHHHVTQAYSFAAGAG